MKTTICSKLNCTELETIPEECRYYCKFFEQFIDDSMKSYCRSLAIEKEEYEEPIKLPDLYS